MAKITEEMKQVAGKAKGFAVATVDKDGTPNVVPIHYAKIISDDEIMLVDNFMKKTEENLKANPDKVAVSVCDFDARRGYQFKGKVRIETSGENFDEGVRIVKLEKPDVNPKAAIIFKVDSIYITTPGPDAGRKVD